MLNNRLVAITKANSETGEYSSTYFQMTHAGFENLRTLVKSRQGDTDPIRSWFGGVDIAYMSGISVALVSDLPDNMWRLVDVNTDVVIEEGFIEDESSLPQEPDEGRTAAENPSGSD